MKPFIALLASLLIILAFGSTPALAVCGSGGGNCFVVAAGGNSNSTATWSASSGGATCTCTPNATDNVILDSAAGNLTIAAALSVANFDATGTSPGNGNPYAGTLTHNAFTLTVSGTLFKLSAGMTYSPTISTRIVSFTAASGTVAITHAGHTLGSETFGSSGTSAATYQFQDAAAVIASGTMLLTSGTLDANGQTVSTGLLSSSNTNTRSLLLGGANWTISGTGVAWNLATTTGLTLTKSTSNISITNTTNAGITFATGGLALNGLTIGANANAAAVFSITGTNPSFSSISINGQAQVTFPAQTTTTITNAFTWAGNPANGQELSIGTSNAGFGSTISAASGSTLNWAILQGLIFTNSAVTATNSFDLGANNMNGGSISPPSGGGGRIIGGF